MLIRCTFFLLLLATSLAAQSPAWQSFLTPTAIIGGAETEGARWLAATNCLAKYDLATGEYELFHYQNSILPRYLTDVRQLDNETFAVLGGPNQILVRRNGSWTVRQLTLPAVTLHHVAGRDQGGDLILAGQDRVYRLPSEGIPEDLLYVHAALNDRNVQAITLDAADRLWVLTYDRLLRFSPAGELLEDLPSDAEEYFYDLRLDDAGNTWVTSSKQLRFRRAASDEWTAIPLSELGLGNSVPAFVATLGSAVVLNSGYRIVHVDGSDGAFETVDWSEHFTLRDRPYGYGFQDADARLWYFDDNRSLRNWKIGSNAPRIVEHTPWLKMHEVNGLGLDPQGRVWLGGLLKTAYFSGGRPRYLPPLDTAAWLAIGVNAFDFDPAGRPIIGTGTMFSFGFPDSQVRVYNGTAWDTLTGANTGTAFLPVTDVIRDRDDNLWVLRRFDTSIMVRSWGDWHRIRTSDLPIAVGAFNCLTEDPNGGMWIGTNNGLLYHDGFTATHVDTVTLKTGGRAVSSIAVDAAGKKWVSLRQGGIRRETDDGWRIVEEFEAAAPFGEAGKIVCGEYSEKWVIIPWNGVMHYDGTVWRHLTSENSGLIESNIRDILVDHRGRTWFSCGSGVSVYLPQARRIESYRLPAEQDLGVYPNPGCRDFTAHWRSAEPVEQHLYLLTADGRRVRQWTVPSVAAGEQSFTFTRGALPAGTYYLVLHQNGRRIATEGVVLLP